MALQIREVPCRQLTISKLLLSQNYMPTPLCFPRLLFLSLLLSLFLSLISLFFFFAPMRYHRSTSRRLFMLLNLFRVKSIEIRSRHLFYRSKNHKYDSIHKRTSLIRSGAKLRLGKMLGTQERLA